MLPAGIGWIAWRRRASVEGRTRRTNIILRFLTGEPAAQAEKVRHLVGQCETGDFRLRIVPLVVAEVVFVLSGRYYGFSREDIARALIQFLETPDFEVENRDVLIPALKLYAEKKIDWVDAYLAAEAMVFGEALASFDKDFRKVSGLDLMRM